jgi:hypothetical protein
MILPVCLFHFLPMTSFLKLFLWACCLLPCVGVAAQNDLQFLLRPYKGRITASHEKRYPEVTLDARGQAILPPDCAEEILYKFKNGYITEMTRLDAQKRRVSRLVVSRRSSKQLLVQQFQYPDGQERLTLSHQARLKKGKITQDQVFFVADGASLLVEYMQGKTREGRHFTCIRKSPGSSQNASSDQRQTYSESDRFGVVFMAEIHGEDTISRFERLSYSGDTLLRTLLLRKRAGMSGYDSLLNIHRSQLDAAGNGTFFLHEMVFLSLKGRQQPVCMATVIENTYLPQKSGRRRKRG